MSGQSKELDLALSWAYLLASAGFFCIGIVLIVVAIAARAVSFIPSWLALAMAGVGAVALIAGKGFWRKATS